MENFPHTWTLSFCRYRMKRALFNLFQPSIKQFVIIFVLRSTADLFWKSTHLNLYTGTIVDSENMTSPFALRD